MIRYFLLLSILVGCASLTQVEEALKPIETSPGKIQWFTSFKEATKTARTQNKPMMLVFYGVSSRRLDDHVFSTPNVIELAQKFVCLKLGSDQSDLTQKYKVEKFPTIIFTDPRGGEYDRFIGYKSQLSFAGMLKTALIPVEAEYSVQIESPQQNSASVKCVFKNIRQKSLILSLNEKHDKISNISYDSTDGRPGWKEIAKNVWQMDFNTYSMKTVTVQYQVGLNILSSTDYYPAYISYLGDDYGILDGYALLLLPQGFYTTDKIRIHLSLPSGWNAITPWEEESPLSFSANYMDEVVDSVFCVGQFKYAKREIGEKEVYVVYCGAEKSNTDLEQKGDVIVQIFKDYISRFGDFPFKNYVAIFAGRTPDKRYIHGSAHGSGFAGPMEMDPTFILQFMAHELFHVWNGRVINQKSEYEAWFKEGFTQYYGYLTPRRTGLYGREQFLQYLRDDYAEYLKKYEAGEDMALSRVKEDLARKEGREHRESIKNWVMYRKGALIAFLVDNEIRIQTKGEKDLDDLMRYMFEEFREERYSSADVLKALNFVTGKDFTQFFSNFVYGKTKLPLAGSLTEKPSDRRQIN